MRSFTDQTGRTVKLERYPPERIISLVPSQTELLYHLGLNDEVTGITKFCVHPQHWFKTKTIVGGTKKLHIEKIRALKPDLIIANKEENVKEQIEDLYGRKASGERNLPVWISDVKNLNDAYEMIQHIGKITGRETEAESLISEIKNNFAQLQTCLSGRQAPGSRLRTCYLIWQKPYMTIGGDTFINNMLEMAGFENIYAGKTRYPEITMEELKTANCQLLLLSSEPFPFKEEHAEELQSYLPETKVMLVDGQMFSWYGSRLLYAADYFRELRENL